MNACNQNDLTNVRRKSGIVTDATALPIPVYRDGDNGEKKLLIDEFDAARWAFPSLHDYLRYLKIEPDTALDQVGVQNAGDIKVFNPDAFDHIEKAIALHGGNLSQEDDLLYDKIHDVIGTENFINIMLSNVPSKANILNGKNSLKLEKAGALFRWKENDYGYEWFVKPPSLDHTIEDTLRNHSLPKDAYIFGSDDFSKMNWFLIFLHEISHTQPDAYIKKPVIMTEFLCDQWACANIRAFFPDSPNEASEYFKALRSSIITGSTHAISLLLDGAAQESDVNNICDVENQLFIYVSTGKIDKAFQGPNTTSVEFTENTPGERRRVPFESDNGYVLASTLFERRLYLYNWGRDWLSNGPSEKVSVPEMSI